jgi:hypothetical protein
MRKNEGPDTHRTVARFASDYGKVLSFLLTMPQGPLDERFAVESLFDIIHLARTGGKNVV